MIFFNWPGVAGAVLLGHPFVQNLQYTLNPKPKELRSWNLERMFTPHHVSHVRCHLSGFRCQVSSVLIGCPQPPMTTNIICKDVWIYHLRCTEDGVELLSVSESNKFWKSDHWYRFLSYNCKFRAKSKQRSGKGLVCQSLPNFLPLSLLSSLQLCLSLSCPLSLPISSLISFFICLPLFSCTLLTI